MSMPALKVPSLGSYAEFQKWEVDPDHVLLRRTGINFILKTLGVLFIRLSVLHGNVWIVVAV